jgi:hypothetical protein
VLLCWLALLLVRFIGTRTGQTWVAVREDLTGPAGTFIPDQQTHHRHPRGAGRARDHPAEEGPAPGSHPLMGLEGAGTFRCF